MRETSDEFLEVAFALGSGNGRTGAIVIVEGLVVLVKGVLPEILVNLLDHNSIRSLGSLLQ